MMEMIFVIMIVMLSTSVKNSGVKIPSCLLKYDQINHVNQINHNQNYTSGTKIAIA